MTPTEAAARVRAVRTRELTRCAMSDLLGGVDPRGHAIADATDAALLGALAHRGARGSSSGGASRAGPPSPSSRWAATAGASAPTPPTPTSSPCTRRSGGATEAEAAASATAIVNRVKKLLGSATSQLGHRRRPRPAPRGQERPDEPHRSSRIAEYAQRWASTWERQAAVRARPDRGRVASPSLPRTLRGASPTADVDRSQSCATFACSRPAWKTSACPRGIEPARHVKLGPGGLTDVEWTIQLIQMRHWSESTPALRTPSTTRRDRWPLGTQGLFERSRRRRLFSMRGTWPRASAPANTLATGRMSGVKLDVLPRDSAELRALAAILGYGSGGLNALEEDWLRAGRQGARRDGTTLLGAAVKIVLVRHGQTPANRLGALDTVRPGLGLTPEGLAPGAAPGGPLGDRGRSSSHRHRAVRPRAHAPDRGARWRAPTG